MAKFFISHSAEDPEIVNAFNDELLRLALGVPKEEIFCTSDRGTLEIGRNFNDDIRENLKESECVIFLITKKFLKSKYCLAELGAAWALKKKTFPLLLDQLNFSVLQSTPFSGMQSIELNHKSKIIQLADEFRNLNLVNDFTSVQLDTKAGTLFEVIKNNESIEEEAPTVEEMAKLKSDYDEAMNYVREHEKKIRDLKKFIENLKATKDLNEINKLEMEGSNDKETFENYVREIGISLRKLDPIVASAIYFDLFSQENFWAKIDSYELRRLTASKYLYVDYDDLSITYNSDHPKLKKCVGKLKLFDDFLNGSPKLVELLEDETEEIISLANIDFWAKFFKVHVII
ncbi:toll/interleukin-1 receptor domain-containing protein [Bacillus haynesii]|uniref:toll/interleukin-1 receptor domain-containing protein n=1 Tax=Bacillus haynesii TaxID=1925021 RepID=UPI002DBB0344|nr:toll/interleukin-1 receptor domain-containing protein [Bacillus haynesii]MEC1530468.1 toll/interleukin-1 receptor domain-containing protein [Bacillus haynesii]